ncbi:MAG: efflux RND transporter permease subunit, partial [Spongiibacteraceae bacterium]|nr:efflux RND transporter permease subunit [Spongiibacteraceae bacterium]
MPNFFIDRPIFAWVIALFMLVIGAACITQLPVTQYPNVAPPQVTVSFNYPGASAQVLDESVISIIENELNGLEGMIYMESESQASGEASIIVTFAAGTDGDLARVDVMNRLSRVNSRLPQTVIQQGIRVEETRSNVLMIVALSSKDGRLDEATLGDYIARNVLPELQRVKGVGEAKLFGSELAMRVWLDTDRMLGFGITPDDVNAALRAQNAQIAAGGLGARPNLDNQTISASEQVQGPLINTDQYAQVL